MSDLKYLDKKGTFTLDDPDLTSYMYFPLANEAGMMSAITPDLGGDIKLDQNTFLLEPVSSENLHNNKSSRNFWVYVEGKGAWSVTGRSSKQQAKLFEDDKEDVKLTAGIMWHQVERQSQEMGLKAVMTSFVPETEEKVELTKFEITNTSDKAQTITSTVAIPMYARSASNIRDHRHVTSLLHRTFTVKNGIMIYPTLTFDERGHNKNKIFYGALAKEEVNGEMVSPVSFCPVTEEFIGRGGNFENPYYVVKNQPLPYKAGEEVDGYETVAAIRFADCTLEPGETRTYIVALGYGESEAEITELSKKYLIKKHFDKYNKLKRTYEALTDLTKETKAEIDHLESISTSMDIARLEEDLVQIKEELTEYGYIKRHYTGGKKVKITSCPFHYLSSDGFHIYVGKNNYQNEELDFKFANGGDWWFHAKGIPGSHVIVKTEGKELPDRVFEEAGALAAYYSKGRGNEKVEVDYIQRKNLKKVPGAAPGFVVYHTNYSLMAVPGITVQEV